MIFHITYHATPDVWNKTQQRFKETGAAPPPGVTMMGRWHSVQGHKGFIIAESADAEALAKWIQEWTDILSSEVTPVITDEQFARVIG